MRRPDDKGVRILPMYLRRASLLNLCAYLYVVIASSCPLIATVGSVRRLFSAIRWLHCFCHVSAEYLIRILRRSGFTYPSLAPIIRKVSAAFFTECELQSPSTLKYVDDIGHRLGLLNMATSRFLFCIVREEMVLILHAVDTSTSYREMTDTTSRSPEAMYNALEMMYILRHGPAHIVERRRVAYAPHEALFIAHSV